MIIQNIEQKIKLALVVSITSIIGGTVLGIVGIVLGYNVASNANNQVYVVNDGVPVVANRTDRENLFEIEATNTIKTFHKLFFTLPPDDKYIEKTINESLYLIDESGVKQRNALMDKGFYSDILAHSANFSILCDSVILNKEEMSFTFYGKQRIEKKYSVTIRELVTAGKIRPISRTENNPFGYIISDYRTLSNKDLSESRKR